MSDMAPISMDPVLIAGNWINQRESGWLDNAARQVGFANDEDDSATRVFTAANQLTDGLRGDTGQGGTSQFMRVSGDKRNVSATARRHAKTFTQGGNNVVAAKTAMNNVLGSYQTAEATNAGLAASQGWPPYKTASESMRLRGDTRNAIDRIRQQFDQVQNALLGDFNAGRDPGTNSRMPGSEGGGRIPITPSGNSPSGVVPGTTPGGTPGTDLASSLTSMLGNPEQLSSLAQTAMPMVSQFLPVIMGLVTAGVSAVTGGTASMTGMGPATLNSPNGTMGGLGGMNGMGGMGGGLTGAQTGSNGSPLSGIGSNIGQGVPGANGAGNSGNPLTGGAGNLLGGKHSGPLGELGKKIDDIASGKTRLGVVHDEDAKTVRVESIGTDGTRTDIFEDAGNDGGDNGGADGGDKGDKPGDGTTTSGDSKTVPASDGPTDGASERPKSGTDDFPGPKTDATTTPAADPPAQSSDTTTPSTGGDTVVAAGDPVDHASDDSADTTVTSDAISSHLTADDTAPRVATTGAMGTDLTSGTPSAPAAAAPTGASPITPATHLTGGMPPMGAPAAGGMPPMGGGSPMSPGGGMPMHMGGMPGMGSMMPGAAAPAAAPTGGTTSAPLSPQQMAPIAVSPDAPATHAPIAPVASAAAPAFPTTGPAAYLGLMSPVKARAHAHLAAIAGSQESAEVRQSTAIGVFERAGEFTYVYATVDGLGYIPEGVELPSGVLPLSVLAAGDGAFFKRWGGNTDTIAKLRAYAAQPDCKIGGYVGGAAMSTADESAIQTREQKDSILSEGIASPVSSTRAAFGTTAPINKIAIAVHSEISNLPSEYADGLDMNRARMIAARWEDGERDARYPWIWRAYLTYAAERAVQEGNETAARYYATEMARMSSALG
ncbi:hypothetical protein [Gordonia sihwensis]|uniref:hypothetical protein n=1 Tax=Gordonia sihwensis TaxID=173559 RepID=UPI003D95B24C